MTDGFHRKYPGRKYRSGNAGAGLSYVPKLVRRFHVRVGDDIGVTRGIASKPSASSPLTASPSAGTKRAKRVLVPSPSLRALLVDKAKNRLCYTVKLYTVRSYKFQHEENMSTNKRLQNHHHRIRHISRSHHLKTRRHTISSNASQNSLDDCSAIDLRSRRYTHE